MRVRAVHRESDYMAYLVIIDLKEPCGKLDFKLEPGVLLIIDQP